MKTRKLIPLTEAAKLLDVSGSRLRELCSQGRIPGAKRSGRNWMLPKDFSISHGTRGPKLSGAHRARAPEQPPTPSVKSWRKTDPHYAKAFDEFVSRFGRYAPINAADFYQIALRHLPRRGKGRGKDRDALARSPTGGSWFVEGGKASKRSPDDPLYDPEGEESVRHVSDRSGDTEDPLTQDERFANELSSRDRASDDKLERPQDHDHLHEHREVDANDDQDHAQASKMRDFQLLYQSSRKLEDDEDEKYFEEDEDQAIDEDVERIREYVRSGEAAASENQSEYPILDAMRALDMLLTRETYLRRYLWINFRTKPTQSLSVEDESILPPMFRRPK